MFQINKIISDAFVKNNGNRKLALLEIKKNYPEYYKTAKNLIESCDKSLVQTTEDFMNEFLEHNKFLQGVINYEDTYELYNPKLDKDGIPLGDPDKVAKAIEKEVNKHKKPHSKAMVQVFDSIEAVEKAYSKEPDFKGLETEIISFCPSCRQIALGKHQCKAGKVSVRPDQDLY